SRTSAPSSTTAGGKPVTNVRNSDASAPVKPPVKTDSVVITQTLQYGWVVCPERNRCKVLVVDNTKRVLIGQNVRYRKTWDRDEPEIGDVPPGEHEIMED